MHRLTPDPVLPHPNVPHGCQMEPRRLPHGRRDRVAATGQPAPPPGELEGLTENVRILHALLDLLESSGAPPGTMLGEALVAGYVSVLEVVEATRAVPDPLAG
jgi:hypothetical protein